MRTYRDLVKVLQPFARRALRRSSRDRVGAGVAPCAVIRHPRESHPELCVDERVDGAQRCAAGGGANSTLDRGRARTSAAYLLWSRRLAAGAEPLPVLVGDLCCGSTCIG